MSKSSFFKPDTIALHSGYAPEGDHGSRAVPIHQTTSYVFKSADQASSLYNAEIGGHIYSRISNPTVAVLEQRIAALEGGVGAICTASGMSAIFTTFVTLCSAGDHIVSAAQIYGSTATLLKHMLKRLGIECTFININEAQALKTAIQPNTKIIFCESIGNPGLEATNLPQISEIAKAAGIPVVIDATFAPPGLCETAKHGGNIIIHSLTKWMGGHGAAIGGVIVDSGNFNWAESGRFPEFVEPSAAFNHISYWQEYGPSAFAMKVRSESMADIGPSMAPQNAFLFLQGIETLNIRMKQHIANAKELISWLESQDGIVWVNHPELDDNPSHDIARTLFPKGAGSMLTIGVVGGRAGGAAFIDAMQLASNLGNVGDSRTLVLHPASTTHLRMTPEALKAGGITEDLIRVSVGLEDIDDIKADFKLGLKAAKRAAGA